MFCLTLSYTYLLISFWGSAFIAFVNGSNDTMAHFISIFPLAAGDVFMPNCVLAIWLNGKRSLIYFPKYIASLAAPHLIYHKFIYLYFDKIQNSTRGIYITV